jgi:drug/metabolite transporter (DMT)-like permease
MTGVPALFFLILSIATVIAWVLIGEAMPPLAWLDMALAAAGVAVANRPYPCARRVDSGGGEQR